MSVTIRRRRAFASVLLLALASPVTAAQTPPPTGRATPSSEPTTPEPAAPPLGDGLELAFAGGRVRLTPATAEPGTGLPLTFRIEVRDADGAVLPPDRVTLPATGDTLGDFEVLGVMTLAPSAGAVPAERRWSVRTFGSGPVVLPAFEVELDGETRTTEPRTVAIASVAGLDTDPAAHRDIASAVEVATPDDPTWWWLGGGAALLLAGLLFWWWRRRDEDASLPAEPADAWALARIEDLLAEGHVEHGRLQLFFFRLTDIARAFIERRFDLAAPDRTTAEFIEEARRHPELGADVAQLLGNLLKAADMVKFAGDRPAVDECDRAVETIRRFVTRSGPRPDPIVADDVITTVTDDPDRRRRAVGRAVDHLDRLETRS